jgi:[acyl-carrier-protein] S-malonyltransferase
MNAAFVFPGQGTQRVGMGQMLRVRSEAACGVFDDASDIVGFDVARMCTRGTADELRETRIAQPSIFVVNAAALAILGEWGCAPRTPLGTAWARFRRCSRPAC